MDVRVELARLVGDRRQGWWGLIATALGDEEASRRSRASLSRDALTANVEGDAISPTIVEHRIQALAAHDQRQLVSLSRDWKHVTEIGQSILDREADFWTTAWLSSLRFLKNQGEVTSIPDGEMPKRLQAEFRVLFRPEAPVIISSWDEVRNRLLADECGYDDIRQLDASEVRVTGQIGRAELADLLKEGRSGQLRMERLRFFFGRGRLIGEEGRRYLTQMVDELWESLHEFGTTPSGVTILVDLALELARLAGVQHDIYKRLVSSLAELERPERLLPIVYLAVGKGWRHP
jgi:hypothetical protein